jgi:hypothetical protein
MTPGSRTPYQPSFPYPRTPIAPFWLYWTTARSAELNSNGPDLTPTLCLAGFYCTAFGYQATPPQYQSFSHIPGTLTRQTGLLLFLEVLSQGVGWSSLKEEVCMAWQGSLQ